jgi:hypothetical protein
VGWTCMASTPAPRAARAKFLICKKFLLSWGASVALRRAPALGSGAVRSSARRDGHRLRDGDALCGMQQAADGRGVHPGGAAHHRPVPSVMRDSSVLGRDSAVWRPAHKGGLQCSEAGRKVGGFAPVDGGTCETPRDEVHWCDLPVPASCRPHMMVHELAHSCGWRHDDGMGVPGNGGREAWRDECD